MSFLFLFLIIRPARSPSALLVWHLNNCLVGSAIANSFADNFHFYFLFVSKTDKNETEFLLSPCIDDNNKYDVKSLSIRPSKRRKHNLFSRICGTRSLICEFKFMFLNSWIFRQSNAEDNRIFRCRYRGTTTNRFRCEISFYVTFQFVLCAHVLAVPI